MKSQVEEYEKQLKDHEFEYNQKLKAMAKEMNLQIELKEREFQNQLDDFIRNQRQNENDLRLDTEQRIHNAEQRAILAEGHFSKVQEQIKVRLVSRRISFF